MSSKKPYRLMTPGPVPMPDRVREALAQPMIHHRTPEFTEILKGVLLKLKAAFQTDQPVMMLTATGSGAMEAAVVNLFSPGDEVLCVVGGKFAERWVQIAEAYGLKAHQLPVKWGESVQISRIKEALEKHKSIKGIFCQASETSTATLNPIKEIAELTKANDDMVFVVDAITALGAMPLPMDEWGLDVVVSGSQKAFMLPAGLSFISLSEKAWEFYEKSKCPKFYLDIGKEKKANDKHQTFFSSAVTLIRALDLALDQFQGKGLNQLIARSQQMTQATHAAMEVLELELLSSNPSTSVTAVKVPEKIDGKKLRQWIEDEQNITLMGGQEHLAGRILRIGHLGAITDEDLLETIKAIGAGLNEFGHSISAEKIAEAHQAALKILS